MLQQSVVADFDVRGLVTNYNRVEALMITFEEAREK